METGCGAGTYLVDKLETFLVGHALVGELNRVERKGRGRVEGDHAGDEEGRSLRATDRKEKESALVVSKGLFHRRARRGSPTREATARAPVASSGDFRWRSFVRFHCDPGIAFSTLEYGQTPAYPGRAPLVNIHSRVMLIAETHLGLVVGRGRLDDDGGLGRLGADLSLGDEGLAGESGGGEGSHLVERTVVVCCWVQEWSKRNCIETFLQLDVHRSNTDCGESFLLARIFRR